MATRQGDEQRRKSGHQLGPTTLTICVLVAVGSVGVAFWLGDLGGAFRALPETITGLATRVLGPEIKPYECASPDGFEDFKLLQEDWTKSGANVANVDLGMFDGIRGLKAVRHIPKGDIVLSIPASLSLSIAGVGAGDKAGQSMSKLRLLPDGDLHLDTVAVMYESNVKGIFSPFKHYFCTLPKDYDLPMGYRDEWSQKAVFSIPNVQRLLLKRQEELNRLESLTKSTMQQTPGGSSFVRSTSRESFHDLYMSAYFAAKTRSIGWDLKEAAEHDYEPLLPPSLTWLREMGVMVPVLDQANHAGEDSATANFTVDYSGTHLSRDLGGKASFVEYRPTRVGDSASKGGKYVPIPTFSLVARRDIQPGEQITFPYLPDDDANPQCNDRWLLEYGIVHHDGKPARDCHSFVITVADLARVTQDPKEAEAEKQAEEAAEKAAREAEKQQAEQGQGEAKPEPAVLSRAARRAKRQKRSPQERRLLEAMRPQRAAEWVMVRLVRTGNPDSPVVDDSHAHGTSMLLEWTKAALGDETRARAAACKLVQEQVLQLEKGLARAQAEAGAAANEKRRADLLRVYEGTVAAAKEAPRALGCA